LIKCQLQKKRRNLGLPCGKLKKQQSFFRDDFRHLTLIFLVDVHAAIATPSDNENDFIMLPTNLQQVMRQENSDTLIRGIAIILTTRISMQLTILQNSDVP
jgi:hypothetical protein